MVLVRTLAPMWVSFQRFIVSMTYCKAVCHAWATRVDDSKTRATASRCGGDPDAMVVYIEMRAENSLCTSCVYYVLVSVHQVHRYINLQYVQQS